MIEGGRHDPFCGVVREGLPEELTAELSPQLVEGWGKLPSDALHLLSNAQSTFTHHSVLTNSPVEMLISPPSNEETECRPFSDLVEYTELALDSNHLSPSRASRSHSSQSFQQMWAVYPKRCWREGKVTQQSCYLLRGGWKLLERMGPQRGPPGEKVGAVGC